MKVVCLLFLTISEIGFSNTLLTNPGPVSFQDRTHHDFDFLDRFGDTAIAIQSIISPYAMVNPVTNSFELDLVVQLKSIEMSGEFRELQIATVEGQPSDFSPKIFIKGRPQSDGYDLYFQLGVKAPLYRVSKPGKYRQPLALVASDLLAIVLNESQYLLVDMKKIEDPTMSTLMTTAAKSRQGQWIQPFERVGNRFLRISN